MTEGLGFKGWVLLVAALVLGNGTLIWDRFKIHFLALIWELGSWGWLCWTRGGAERLGCEMLRPSATPSVPVSRLLPGLSEPDLRPLGPHARLPLLCTSQVLLVRPPSLSSLPLAVMCLVMLSRNRMRHTRREAPAPREGGFGGKAHTALCDVGSKVLLQEGSLSLRGLQLHLLLTKHSLHLWHSPM